jgi:hypothetical protein
MIALSTGSRRAPLKDRRNDLYETPRCATLALLRAEKLPKRIWEPACGRGAIVTVLRAHGHDVVASDLVDYGIPITPPGYYGRDFLFELHAPEDTEAIVTNPPFRLAGEFVEHALELCPRVMMLLRLAFLESERRSPILESGMLARVHVFRKRLPMMHRHGWAGRRATSAMAFGWFCWDRGHKGPPTLHRISWDACQCSDEHVHAATARLNPVSPR